MLKLLFVFLIGLALGYGYGYRDGDIGDASIAHRALDKLGVLKVKEDHEQRQRLVEQIQRTRADSSESASHH